MNNDIRAMMAFAKRHDWGSDASVTPAGGLLVGEWVGDGTTWERQWTEVFTLQQLRDWAGY